MAKEGNAYIEIKPDLSGFKEELKAALEKINATVKVTLKPDIQTFKQDLRDALAKVQAKAGVKLAPDTRGFTTEVKAELAKLKQPVFKVKIEPDMTGFRAEMMARKATASAATVGQAVRNVSEREANKTTQALLRIQERAFKDGQRQAERNATRLRDITVRTARIAGQDALRDAAMLRAISLRTAQIAGRDALRAAADVARAAKIAERATATAARAAEREAAKAFKAVEKAGQATLKSITKFGKGGMLAKIRPIVALVAVAATAIGPLIAVLNGATAAALSLSVALGSALAGGMAGLAGDAIALGQALLVVKFASAGMGDAFKAQGKILADERAGLKPAAADVKKLQVAMAGLSPAAQGFVTSWGKVRKALDPVRKAVQEKLFAGLGDELDKTSKALLPTLQTELGRTAGVLNTTAKSFGTWARTADTTKLIGDVMQSNTAAVSTMGSALTPLVDVMLRLGRAVAPLTQMMADYIASWIKAKDVSVQAGEKSGSLAVTVGKMKDTLKTLMSILSNVAGALKNTFTGSFPAGQTLLGMLDRLTKKWKDWTDSTKGKNAIASFADKAVPTMTALGGLIGDIFKLWQDLSKQSDGPAFIQQVRDMIGPVGDLLKQLSGGDTFKNLSEAFTKIAQALADANGGGKIAAAAKDVSLLVQAIAGFVTAIPGGPQAIGAIVKSMAALTALKLTFKITGLAKFTELVGKIPGVNAAVGKLRGKLVGLASKFGDVALSAGKTFGKKMLSGIASVGKSLGEAALSAGKFAVKQGILAVKTVALNVALLAQLGWQKLVAAATKVWAAVQWLLNIAMDANPIGLIIIAIVAIIAVIILLVLNWKRVVAVAKVVWTAVVAGAQWLWGWIKKIFGAVWSFLQGVWQGIVDFVVGVWNGLLAWFQIALAHLAAMWQAVWNWVVDIVTGVWNGIVAFISTVWNGLVAWFQTALAAYAAIWKAVWDWIVQTVTDVWNGIVSFISGIWNGLVAWFQIELAHLQAMWQTIWRAVRDTVTGVWDTIVGAIRGAWKFIRDTVTKGISNLVKFFRDLPGNLLDAVGDVVQRMEDLGGDIVRGIWDGIRGLAGWLLDHVLSFVHDTIPGPILKFFGIESPSKLMRDTVGKPIGQGVAWGMDLTRNLVANSAIGLSIAATPPLPVPGANSAIGLDAATTAATASNPTIRVYIGERELTDLVRVTVDGRNEDMARALLAGRRI